MRRYPNPVLSDNENNCKPAFNFEQNLYKQALDLAEYEDDPWKELNMENIIILEEASYEETGSEYTKEIPEIKAKPITLCIIINNNHRDIGHYNRTSKKRLQELIGIWKIDIDAISKVNKKLYLLGVCLRHFNYNQNTVHSKKLKG
ncbi:2346_t:CDS:2 [Dentiscutata heterogama]|uniref:2346_t:CDS:1 n=1 Tax=Dentiscutata heterogama TaxID=1316150 RepID=A0ACA9KI13_9GLOM|nr:2346_t:CDS:2 [Dentiscutata heterogama]